MNIILSIKPKWAELIYSGKKTIEWRKSYPTRDNIELVYLYETAPVKKVTGFFKYNYYYSLVFGVTKDGKPADGAQVLIDRGCVSLDDLKKYAGNTKELFGWKIKNPQKYKEPLDLSFFNFERERPPQSWCYDLSDLPF